MATRRLKGVNMHKSYQPILPSTNKLLKKKWDEMYYNEHRRLVSYQWSLQEWYQLFHIITAGEDREAYG